MTRFQSRSAKPPMRRALPSSCSATAKSAIAAASTAVPIAAAIVSSVCDSPPVASNPTATTANTTLAKALKTAVAAVATATCSARNPQRRNIEYERAMPTASPPGTTLDAAVDACDITSAWTNERPGSAAIQGGAKVRRLRTAAATSATRSSVLRPETMSHTSR